MKLGTTQTFSARIIKVDTANHQVSVSLQCDEGSVWNNVPLMVPYANASEGGGSMSMPEVGAGCTIMFPSDRGMPMVIGYNKPDAPGEGQSAGMTEMAEGDQVIAAGNDGYIILRRCGVLELGATQMSSIMFIPVGNLIRMFFGNLELASGLGTLTWKGDKNTGGVRMGIATKSGGVEQVILRAGYIANGFHAGPDNVKGAAEMNIELVVSPDGGATTVFGLHVSQEGRTSLYSDENVGFLIRGSYEIDVKDYVKLASAKDFTIASGTTFDVDATGQATVHSDKAVVVTAGSAQMMKATATGVDLAQATSPVALANGTAAAINALATALDGVVPGTSAAITALMLLNPVAAKQVKAS